MGKSEQNGVSRDPEVELRPTRRRIGDPEKQRILAEVDQARGTGTLVLARFMWLAGYRKRQKEHSENFSGGGA